MLDEILRETERRRRGEPASVTHAAGAEAERERLRRLAERIGPKGALAGLLAEMQRFASSP